MDEPTSSLDYENRLKIKKLLLEQAKNRTIIIATHDPLLQEIADSLTILD
jgi:ABC-type lipoprotein export system ATPase subunit